MSENLTDAGKYQGADQMSVQCRGCVGEKSGRGKLFIANFIFVGTPVPVASFVWLVLRILLLSKSL